MKTFARLSIMIFVGCGLAVLAALAIGQRNHGLSYGYQVDSYPCTIQMIDTDRPSAAFAAYTERQQGAEELFILEVNNGAVRRLTNNAYRDDSPSWSPDGIQLVFTSSEDGYNELHIINVATGERHQLTHFTIGYVPNWSPDGKSILFMSNMDHSSNVYIIGADGTGLRRLTDEHYSNTVWPMWLFPQE